MGHDKFVEMNLKDIQYDELFRLKTRDLEYSDYDWIMSLDLHPTKPWILTSWSFGAVDIMNYRSKTFLMYFKAFDSDKHHVSSAKFVARKHWVVAGGEDAKIYVYNYNTKAVIKKFKAHKSNIRCVAVHPTLPYVLSSSCDMRIKLWDWDKEWICSQTFEGHSNAVMQVTFNPKDITIFASASLDKTVKIWNLGSRNPDFTLGAHSEGVNSVEYYPDGDKPYLISGSADHTAKVWDYQAKSCVQTLEGHTDIISSASFHPDLPIVITCSKDGTVRVWNSITYRLENTQNYGINVGPISYMKGSSRAAVVCRTGVIFVKLGRGMPVASMANSGKIIWAEDYKIQLADIRHVEADYEVTDGARLPLSVQKLACNLYPQYLKHNPNGSLVAVGGDGEFCILTSKEWKFRSNGYALDFVWSSNGEYAVRESTSLITIFCKNFQKKQTFRTAYSAECIYGGPMLAVCYTNFICFNDWAEYKLIQTVLIENVKNLYWADSGDLLAITCDNSYSILKYNHGAVLDYSKCIFDLLHSTYEIVRTGIWAGNCFVYINSSWNLKCCFGGEVIAMFCLDRPMCLLGYLASQGHIYLIDKDYNVIGHTLSLSLIQYKSLVMRGDLKSANALLPYIPKRHCNSVARFLESNGMIDDALGVATDPDYRFELAIRLGRLEIAKEIASETGSKSKWKQLGELTMSTGKFEMAEECLKKAMDYSSLLLLYSSTGDAEGMCGLANLAREQGRNNVAFLCLFMLGRLEDCLELLVHSNRIPEAALMARSYLPSRVSEIVEIWRTDLSKTNPKVAESLADPQEHPNLFENWRVAQAVESKVAKTR